MAADRFLDTDGLRHLWEKIKSFIHQNTHEYSVEELETPTEGYRNSYRLDKDGEAIVGSDTIDIPTELTPIVSKQYLDDSFYASTTSVENSSRYFMTVTPNAANTFWYVKFRVRVWIPVDTTDNRFTDSIIEYFGSGITMKCYRIWNTINTGSAAYYQAAFWLTESGLTNGFGHVLGTSIRYGTNYTNSAWYRYVKVDLLAYEGCTVDVFDELTKWTPYKESAGASSSDYLTDQSTYNATSQGLQETGDATDVTNMYLTYAKFTAGTNGIMNRSLIMEDGQGKWQSFTTSSGTGTSKTKNPSGFRIGSKIYYLSSSTDVAADAILGTSIVRVFVSLIDFRYTLNITTTAGGANNLVPYKPLFIVGTIGNDGLFYLDDIWWTQDEPSTENGKIYIKVSPAVYNDYTNDRCYRGDLLYNGDAYWYKNGRFQRYYDADWKADKVANAVNGNLAGLDATGNLTDSGYKPSDFLTQHQHLPEYTIEKLAQAETSYSASYVLKKDNVQVGATINIPKDMVVSSGEVKTVTTANVPYQGAVVGDKYIDLTIANTAQNHIYIPVKDLVDVYVAGNGIDISQNNYIAVKIDSGHANGLAVGGSGLALYQVTPSINGEGGTNGSMLATDKEKLDKLRLNSTEVILNGRSGSSGIQPWSLCAFGFDTSRFNVSIMYMTSMTATAGSGGGAAITGYAFPIGCKIYYHPDAQLYTASTNFVSKRFYTSYDEVDARYSSQNGTTLSLGSSTQSTVFLRVEVDEEAAYWRPYHKDGETYENICTPDGFVANNYYIYLGKTVGSTGYKFQLEDNNPLYYYDGTDLINWATKQGEAGAQVIGNYLHAGDTIGQISVNNFNPVSDTVHVTPQVLGASQKAQARENISAQETLVSDVNIKTINKESLLGSGDIVLPTVDQCYTKDVATSVPNGGFLPDVVYNIGTISGIVIFSLATAVNGKINHYFWAFTTGGTAPSSVTWPNNLTWVGGEPTIETYKYYEISILNGVAAYLKVGIRPIN